MSVLGDDRAAIAAVTRTIIDTVHELVPDRIVPPAAIVTPSDPWLEHRETDTFATMTASWEVWVVRGAETNETATSQLDTEIEDVVSALVAERFSVERVSEPFTYAVQGGNYLTSIIHVTTGVTFT